MFLRRLICIIATTFTLVFARVLSAQMTPVCWSIYASVDEAATVVIARVANVGGATPDKYGTPRGAVMFDIEQAIKGTAPKHLTLDAATSYRSENFVLPRDPGPDDFKTAQRTRTRLMLFLTGGSVWVINLDSPENVTADLKLLKTPAELAQAAREEVQRTSGATNQDFIDDAPPHPQLKGTRFENCTILIPVDDRLLKTEEGHLFLAVAFDYSVPVRLRAKMVVERWRVLLSSECDERELSVLRSLVSERQTDPDGKFSATLKWVQRMGDSAAKCLLANYGLDALGTGAMESAVISIARDSFSAPDLIEHENDKRPSATLILLGYLRLLNWANHTNSQTPELEMLIKKFDQQEYKEMRYREDRSVTPAPFKMTLDIPKLPQVQHPDEFPHPGPITDADPSVRHHVTLMVPTRFKIARDANTLSVGLDPATMRPVEIIVGKKMVIGEREDDRIYEAGQPRPVNAGGVGFSGLNEHNGEASISTGATRFYNRSQGHIPEPGKTYVVEMKITVFETNLPPQHMWRPKMDRVLWTGTLKTTVAP